MAINVIDNFSINVTKPIDSRLVVADAAARNAIIYKYDGMPVFQLNNRFTYTWNSTTVGWEILNEDVMDGYFPVGNNLKLVSSTMYSALGSGKVGINVASEDPKGVLQLNSTEGYPCHPLTFHLGDSSSGSVIGYNWYYDGSEQKFEDSGFGCSAIRFDDDGIVYFKAFKDGDSPGVFTGPSMMVLNPWTNSTEFSSIIYITNTSALSFGNFSSETKIYSPIFDDLSFDINGSNVLYLHANKVGVGGITNPSYSLHTYGSIGLSGSIHSDNIIGVNINSTEISRFSSSTASISGDLRISGYTISPYNVQNKYVKLFDIVGDGEIITVTYNERTSSGFLENPVGNMADPGDADPHVDLQVQLWVLISGSWVNFTSTTGVSISVNNTTGLLSILLGFAPFPDPTPARVVVIC